MKAHGLALALVALALAALLPAAPTRGESYVGGVLPADAVWTLANSPYVVTENLTVPEGVTLTIQPGVSVRFDFATGLEVLGGLVATGNETDHVVFGPNTTVLPPPGFWRGILVESAAVTLENVTIESAEVALTVRNVTILAKDLGIGHANTGLHVRDGGFLGLRVAVTATNRTGILAVNATVELDRSRLSQNVHGVAAVDSTLVFRDSELNASFIDEFNLTASTATLLNTTREGTLLFRDAASILLERQRLAVAVVDAFGTGVQTAAVNVTDNDNGSYLAAYVTDVAGDVGILELARTARNLTAGAMDYAPYRVDAWKGTLNGTALASLAAFETAVVTLAGDLNPPVAVAADLPPFGEDVPVTLDASASTDNDGSFGLTSGNFTWNFADGSKAVTLFGRLATYAWETPGNYSVRLAVRDAAGNPDETFLAVTVLDRTPPQVTINATAYVAVNVLQTLRGSATDNDPAWPAGANYTWAISGPASAVLYGPTVEYAYPLPGRYAVNLTVRDASGNANTTTKSVDVAAQAVADLTLPTIGLAALALLVGAWFGGTDRGQSALFLFFLPLYTREKDAKVLDQFTRGQIFGYVRVHPGDSFTDLKRNLQLENGVLAYHLNVLEKENLVRSRTKGTRRLYFPLEAVPVEDGGLHELQDRMLETLQGAPGITVRELADKLGVSRQLAVYHLRALASRGLAKVDRQGLKMRCFADIPPPQTPGRRAP